VAAYRLGFRRIMVMHGGDKEWAAHGFPLASPGAFVFNACHLPI
jgi:hypothetical protein